MEFSVLKSCAGRFMGYMVLLLGTLFLTGCAPSAEELRRRAIYEQIQDQLKEEYQRQQRVLQQVLEEETESEGNDLYSH